MCKTFLSVVLHNLQQNSQKIDCLLHQQKHLSILTDYCLWSAVCGYLRASLQELHKGKCSDPVLSENTRSASLSLLLQEQENSWQQSLVYLPHLRMFS